MKAYKGFDKNLKCREFQYKNGETYETETAKLCANGFHACENPLDTFNYYPPTDSRYCEVDLDDNGERGDDSKVCGTKIKIGAEIGVRGIINAEIKFVMERCKDAAEEHASGYRGNAAVSGERGTAAASGDEGNAAASGDEGNAAASGFCGNAAAFGNKGNAAASGYGGNAAVSGYRGTAATTGTNGKASADGKQCVAVAWGANSCARGKVGTWIVVSERNSAWEIINAGLAKVDGKNIKENAWYTMRNGKIVEK